METVTSPPRELPIVGGHLALDFANTVDDPLGPKRWDHIATVEGLMHWAERVGLMTGEATQGLHPPVSGADSPLSSAHLLREALNDVFGSLAEVEPVGGEAWGRLRRFIAEALDTAALTPADAPWGTYRYDWIHLADVRSVIHPVAAAAGQLLISDEMSRLKRCARARCPWLFLDYSKNYSRRWCNMDDCGRAEKIERYLAKRAAQRTAKPGEAEDSQ